MSAVPASAVLADPELMRVAEARARRLGLVPATDGRKHWDNVRALEGVLAVAALADPVADLGCRSGIILTWLDQLGYRNLWGCDVRSPLPPIRAAVARRRWTTALAAVRMYLRQRARMRRAPAEATGLSAGEFAAVTSMSVIEHGVDVDAFLEEAARLLRSGGALFLSTDYWPDGVDLGGLRRWEAAHGDDIVFDLAGARRVVERAAAHGLELVGEPDLERATALIEEDGFLYTFLFLAFRRT